MTRKRRAIPNDDRKARAHSGSNTARPDKVDMRVVQKSMKVPILKAEERVVTGVAMTPDAVDAHGEWFSEATIKKAAHEFLANFNKATKLGIQHKVFNRDIELLESSILRQSTLIGDKIVKKGSWIVTVKVNDDTIWNMIKQGKITGFSIGGRAKARVA